MTFDENLAERIRLARKKNIDEKKMFGGMGFLLNGNMLVGVWKDPMIVHLGPDDGHEALKEPHVTPFDITGRAKKGWVLVAAEGVADDRRHSHRLPFIARKPSNTYPDPGGLQGAARLAYLRFTRKFTKPERPPGLQNRST